MDLTPAPDEQPLGEIRARGGRIALSSIREPSVLLVRARGYIGPGLIRQDLRHAAEFGRNRPHGWVYIADTSGVRLANPINLVLLRRIKRLPNLRAYMVIAPSFALRLAAAALSPILKPDAVVRTRDEALERARHVR